MVRDGARASSSARQDRAHRERELHVRRRSWRPRAPGSPTSTPRACPASATTAAASTWTSPRASPRSARWRCFPGAEHVNVQPHSGAQANMAAYFASCEPGDRILGMNLAHGGHLTHGIAINFSGRLYEVHAYGVREDDRAHRLRRARGEGARGPAEGGRRRRERLPAHHRLRAHGRHRPRRGRAAVRGHGPHRRPRRGRACIPSPFPHADIVTTTTHKTLRGPRGG